MKSRQSITISDGQMVRTGRVAREFFQKRERHIANKQNHDCNPSLRACSDIDNMGKNFPRRSTRQAAKRLNKSSPLGDASTQESLPRIAVTEVTSKENTRQLKTG